MESEGQPYKVSLHDECIYIEGPRPSLDSGCSIRIDPGMGDVAKVDAIQEGLDLAYAEGRKAMEKEIKDLRFAIGDSDKDFRELLELANSIENIYPGRYEHVERFKAWKKARGIE